MNGAELTILQKQMSLARVNWHSAGEMKIPGWAIPTIQGNTRG